MTAVAETATAEPGRDDTGQRPGAPRRRRYSVGRLIAWIVLFLFIVITLAPFLWMLRTALSNNRVLFTDPDSPLPVDFTWGPLERVLGTASTEEAQAEGGSGASMAFWGYLRNSVIVSTLITVGQVFFSALAAYAFARLRWPGRDKVFFAFLTALMVPPVFTMLPNFLLIKNLDLINTYPGIVAPFFFMTPFAVFFLRQFFLGINRELEEAAMIDGAGHFRIFFRIILPMSTAPMITLAILTFINAWNEYFWPQLVGQDESVRVLTVALSAFRTATPQTGPDWAGLMAASLVAAVPTVLLFLVFGRKIVDSIQFTGVK
ncbi:carbohydrate ABC transporter permease [Streptomyces radicis]|uniref:Carbohydrate ABC transporter permease n=1 Tax=Streptomyces radicis TaxID=1750517 RepID=A0A3A9VX04_9ACTN|nr:carbohydrate ABC transporter permease [Streptomyces radicis]RKN05555.1 carbohydrate ABC transporter permease [Streptomyces radicis]RKN17424.1 carbohydrate ABC transporter permease [Streptomyces radicis]